MAAVRLSLEKDAALEAATKQQASAHRTATLTQELEVVHDPVPAASCKFRPSEAQP